jgi:hypothetical protein
VDTYEGREVIKAKAFIWKDEYPAVYDLLKSQASEGKFIGTSWEIYYSSADEVDGVRWLKDVTFAGTCIVDNPAYGSRTPMLSVAEQKEKEQMEELQKESGAVKHLTLKEVAELDPFNKRAEILKNQAEALLANENAEKGDDFSKNLKKKLKGRKNKKAENIDTESLKTEFTPFLEETWKYWGVDEEKIKNAIINAEVIDPKTEDYLARQADIDPAKFGDFTVNPDTQNLDWEALKDKIFIPTLPDTLNDRPLSEVAKYLIDNYSDKYKIPGIEFWKFMLENPYKVPTDPKGVNLKDGNYYFNFGSLVRRSGGLWPVPYAHWDGSGWARDAGRLGSSWHAASRVVLLEI